MKLALRSTWALTLVLGALGALGAPGSAAAKSKVGELLRDAIAEVKASDRDCKKDVLDDLRDVLDGLDDASRDRTRRKLRAILDAADDDCPKSVKRALRRSLDALEDRGDDDDGDRDSRKPRKKAAACWNAADPGCGSTKNGRPPMSAAAFAGFQTAIQASSPNVFMMLDQVKAGIGNQYLTSLQLQTIVRLFKPSVFQMLDVVKACAPRLVDPENGGVVSAELAPNVFQQKEAAEAIGAQHGDQ